METDVLVFNGINATSGTYLLPSMTSSQISDIIRQEKQDTKHLQELRAWYQYLTQASLGPKEGIDPKLQKRVL
jgi:hypothetical protein